MNTLPIISKPLTYQDWIPVVLLTVTACAVDLMTPLGVALGVLYLLSLLATLPLQHPRASLFIAIISTGLIIFGYLMSPGGGDIWAVMVNRTISVAAVWITYIIVLTSIQATASLQSLHQQFQIQTEKSSKELQDKHQDTQRLLQEVKQAQLETQESEALNRLILASAGEGIYGVDTKGNTTFVNPSGASMLGYSPEELIGRPMHSTIHHTKPDGSPYPREECPMYAAFMDGSVHRVENEVLWRKDGTSFPVEYTSTPIRNERGELDGAVVTFSDITKRIQTKEFLRANAHERQLILDNVPALIASFDCEHRYRFANKRYLEWFNLTAADLIGKHAQDFLTKEIYSGTIQPYMKRAIAGETVTYQIQIPHAGGGLRWVEATYVPDIDSRGTIKGFFAMVVDIHQRKLYEEQLQSATNRLQLATTSAQIGIWDWDVVNNVLMWDDRMHELYGTNSIDFPDTYQAWAKRVHPDDRERAERELERGLRGLDTFDTEFRIIWPDGSIHFLEAHALVERNPTGSALRMIGINRDITERKRAEEKVRMVVEASPSGMVMINQNGKIVLVNQVLERQFGYEREELLDKVIECLIPERFRTQHPSLRTDFFAHPQSRDMRGNRELYGLRKDGSEFPVEIGLNPFSTEEGVFVLASVIDITARKREEATLYQYMDELHRSNQELDDFAQIASHDLKEPLRGIFNYSTILLEDYGSTLDEDAHSKCETLLRLSRRMEDLIDSLHYFSRAGRTELAKRPTDLQQVLDEVLESLDVRLQECGVFILIPKSLPTVTCDQVRVGEIFRNLITNAMKYNNKDQKWIEIGYIPAGNVDSAACILKREGQEKTDNMTADSDEQRATSHEIPIFYVRDNGIGIREKHLASIFRIFKRLHGRDKFGGGTGAGLTITKKLVERHGGTLWVESTYGDGTTFFFTLQKSLAAYHDQTVGVR